MILHSAYLNPFQPFPERRSDNQLSDDCHDAIEDNMSRSVFSAIGNAERSEAISLFLEILSRHGSNVLAQRASELVEILRQTAPDKIEIGLQSWPVNAMSERDKLVVVLIGISSSHQSTWTHDQREAPENPKPDAWIYIPGKMLLVFECKNDEHPLDATQISCYLHRLKILDDQSNIPVVAPGERLLSKQDAIAVQHACQDIVLDVPWTSVAQALGKVQCSATVDELGRWLAGSAARYINAHTYPPYRGTQTILDWLAEADSIDRRKHLRRLLSQLGNGLLESSECAQDGITFFGNADAWDFEPGAGSAVYVKLKCGAKPVEIEWLGRIVHAVLWFQFTPDVSQRVGLEYYLQSSGSCASCFGKHAWNEAVQRHAGKAKEFEDKMARWLPNAPIDAAMMVSAVRFKGNKRNWQGGGQEFSESLKSPKITPERALTFLRDHRDELWAFPEVRDDSEILTAASQVRKPSVSLLMPLTPGEFSACGNDAAKFQLLLKNVVERGLHDGTRGGSAMTVPAQPQRTAGGSSA